MFKNTDEFSSITMGFQRLTDLFHHETVVSSHSWFATCSLIDWQEFLGTCLLHGTLAKPNVFVCERSGDVLDIPRPQMIEDLPFGRRSVVIYI